MDGGGEIIFKINSLSNGSQQLTIYLLFRETPYNIRTRFYDGAVVTAGGVDDVIEPSPPTNPPTEIPVEPVKAELTYSFSTGTGQGDSAGFYVPIPPEALNEVGGASTAHDQIGRASGGERV